MNKAPQRYTKSDTYPNQPSEGVTADDRQKESGLLATLFHNRPEVRIVHSSHLILPCRQHGGRGIVNRGLRIVHDG